MPAKSPTKGKGRHSDPSTSLLTPLRGNFASRLSKGSRARSLSPRKQPANQPLHIRMNLTETQMDKITDAVTHKVNGSPAKVGQKEDITPSKSSHRHTKSAQTQPETPRRLFDQNKYRDRMGSPTFSELMPEYEEDILSSTLATRRRRDVPPPIQLGRGRVASTTPRRADMEAVSALNSPLSPAHFISPPARGDQASLYSQESRGIRQPSPLKLRADKYCHPISPMGHAVQDSYEHWFQLQNSPMPHGSLDSRREFTDQLRRSKSISEDRRHQASRAPPPSSPLPTRPVIPGKSAFRVKDSPLFSPLPLYFRSHKFPVVKKGEKTMIGDNGWLERTDNTPDKGKKTAQKKAGILDSIKKIAKDMTELHHPIRRHQPVSKETPGSHMAISLDARQQSLLYCELEFQLTNSVNDYITAELDRGHLDPDKLKKVADAWQQLGRPKVVGFRYDLETQLELVSLHVDDFVFYGRRQSNPVEIAGLLYAMKINARAMRIRTFCQPDSVIAKQLVESQSLFNMLNAPRAQQIALAEVAQFFKVIVEREMDTRERLSRDVRQSRVDHGRDDEPHRTQASFGGGRSGHGVPGKGHGRPDDIFA